MADEPEERKRADSATLGREEQAKVRHELRTPINQILGYSELLQEEAEGDGHPQYIPDLQRIQSAARRLIGMVDNLFTPSGQKPVSKETPRPERPEGEAPQPEGPPKPPGEQTGVKWRALSPKSAPPTEPESQQVEVSARDRLLVVDDNELNRDMLCRRLRTRGYSVDVAEDGEQALLKIGSERFDAVLLDVMMPGISGFDVLKIMRTQHAVADLPVIMATAKDDSEDIVEALRLGANDYVTKPLDFPVVLARIQTQLSLKRAKERVQRLAEELEIRNRFIRKTFGRYLSDEVVGSLLESSEGLRLGGESRVVTILMSDLRGFTAAAERLSPEQVVRVLNNYLGTMADIITKYRGTIDEFIGDAILVIFGAPFPGDDDALRALACALEMQRAMEVVNAWNRNEGLPEIEMGIGINTGEVVVGNIGSQTRAKYGVVGSHVNLTGRIEGCTVGGQILISESSLRFAGEGVVTGKSFSVNAKGFSDPVTLHDLRGVHGRYELDLAGTEPDLVPLETPVPIRYSILSEKTVGDDTFPGTFVSLSPRGAEVRAAQAVPLLGNVKIRLEGLEAADVHGDLYAKVVESPLPDRPGFSVIFTRIPPEVAEHLHRLV